MPEQLSFAPGARKVALDGGGDLASAGSQMKEDAHATQPAFALGLATATLRTTRAAAIYEKIDFGVSFVYLC